MSITSGTYTIGTGGDYINLYAFLMDIHATGVNGNITGTFISDVEDYRDLSPDIRMNGYILTITSNNYHYGYQTSYRLIMHNVNIYFESSGTIIIEKLSLYLASFKIYSFSYYSNRIFHMRYCFFKTDFNINRIVSVKSYWYRNVFIVTSPSLCFNFVRDNVAIVENNTFVLNGYVELQHLNNNNVTFRNNLFNILSGTQTIVKNSGNYVYGYNNSSNKSDIINGFFTSGSGNIVSINYTNEIISTTITNSDYYRVYYLSTYIKNSGVTPTITENNLGIRLNSIPHKGYYSIGADDYFYQISPEKIRFTYKASMVDIMLPLYPYTSYIKLPFDKSVSTNNRVLLYDYGSLYDKRSCICKLIMTSSEVSDFNTNILNKYYNDTDNTLEIEIGTNSGFYPFGHDFGCIGPFIVKMDILTAPKLSTDFFGMFEVEIRFYLCGAPPSVTFDTEQSQGNVTIGTITGLKFPQNYYQTKRNQEWVNTELQGVYNTNRVIHDMYYVETQFNLNCNISKAQRLLQYITSTNRANKYNISSDSGGYIMGYDNGTGTKTIIGTLLNNELVVTTNNYNDIDISLSFGSERSDIT